MDVYDPFDWHEVVKYRRWNGVQDLEAHLLQAPPFVGCEDNYIKKIYEKEIDSTDPVEKVECRDRRKLTFELSDLLFTHHLYCLRPKVFAQEMLTQTRAVLSHLKFMQAFLEAMREHPSLSVPAHAALSRRNTGTIKAARELIRDIDGSFSNEDFVTYAEPRSSLLTPGELFKHMRERFFEYGPPRYTDTSRRWAIAMILIHCGFVERAPAKKVMEMLRQSFNRFWAQRRERERTQMAKKRAQCQQSSKD